MIRAGLFTLLFVMTHASLRLLFPFGLTRFALCAALYTAGNVAILYLLFHPRNQWLVANRSRVESNGNRRVALTFDDGPDLRYTPRVLAVLAAKRVAATFFVVGRKAEEQPELVRRIVAEGHEVANHTYSHPALFCFLTPGRLRREIVKCQEAIAGICGRQPRYFRSPVGLRHPLLNLHLRRSGLEFISWQVRSFDIRVQKPEALARRLVDKAAPGDIILLHDRSSAGVEGMLAALPGVIDGLKSRGFEFVVV